MSPQIVCSRRCKVTLVSCAWLFLTVVIFKCALKCGVTFNEAGKSCPNYQYSLETNLPHNLLLSWEDFKSKAKVKNMSKKILVPSIPMKMVHWEKGCKMLLHNCHEQLCISCMICWVSYNWRASGSDGSNANGAVCIEYLGAVLKPDWCFLLLTAVIISQPTITSASANTALLAFHPLYC